MRSRRRCCGDSELVFKSESVEIGVEMVQPQPERS